LNYFINTLWKEAERWFEFFFISNTPGRVGEKLRGVYWRKRFNKCGSIEMGTGCTVISPENIVVGYEVSFLRNCYICASNNGNIQIKNRVNFNQNVIIDAADNGRITIGDDVLMGPNVILRASNHKYILKDIPINKQGHVGEMIIIEDDVWIGSNVVILPNVSIGKGAIIGAGAIVTHDIPPYALAVGIPARVIKEHCRH